MDNTEISTVMILFLGLRWIIVLPWLHRWNCVLQLLHNIFPMPAPSCFFATFLWFNIILWCICGCVDPCRDALVRCKLNKLRIIVLDVNSWPLGLIALVKTASTLVLILVMLSLRKHFKLVRKRSFIPLWCEWIREHIVAINSLELGPFVLIFDVSVGFIVLFENLILSSDWVVSEIVDSVVISSICRNLSVICIVILRTADGTHCRY